MPKSAGCHESDTLILTVTALEVKIILRLWRNHSVDKKNMKCCEKDCKHNCKIISIIKSNVDLDGGPAWHIQKLSGEAGWPKKSCWLR